MTPLYLPAAERLALEAQEAGRGSAIVHLVANRGDLPLDFRCKLVAFDGGEVQGGIHAFVDAAAAAAARDALTTRASRVYSIEPGADGGRVVGLEGGHLEIFAEVLLPPQSLVIVGAGHIAQPLARIGAILDFRVTVIDDRPEFATRARFPEADEIRAQPFHRALATTPLTTDTYVVLVTRGHVHDQACLEQVLPSPVPYIGMVGSQRRVRTCMKNMRAKGFTSEQLERVYAPIGLDIASETPAEIALAIAAEIVNVRRGGRALHLALRERLRV